MGLGSRKRAYTKNLGDVGQHGVFKELKEDQCHSREARVDGAKVGNTSRKHSVEGQPR